MMFDEVLTSLVNRNNCMVTVRIKLDMARAIADRARVIVNRTR